MAQIEYCDDDTVRSWHPAYADDYCGEPRKDEWSAYYYYGLAADECVVTPLVDDYLESAQQEHREQEFKRLASRWKRETAIYGHLSKIVMHPDYQRIMAMGPDVIPLILQDLSRQSAHWFWALHNLVPPGQDPAEGLTTMTAARRAWLDWGRDNNFL